MSKTHFFVLRILIHSYRLKIEKFNFRYTPSLFRAWLFFFKLNLTSKQLILWDKKKKKFYLKIWLFDIAPTLSLISTSGHRIRWSYIFLKRHYLPYGSLILMHTPKGLISHHTALKLGIGGEPLLKIRYS